MTISLYDVRVNAINPGDVYRKEVVLRVGDEFIERDVMVRGFVVDGFWHHDEDHVVVHHPLDFVPDEHRFDFPHDSSPPNIYTQFIPIWDHEGELRGSMCLPSNYVPRPTAAGELSSRDAIAHGIITFTPSAKE